MFASRRERTFAFAPLQHLGREIIFGIVLASGRSGIRSLNDAARRAGLPVVDEVMWEASDDSPGYRHHYPSLEQVRAWLGEAGFALVDELASVAGRRVRVPHHVLAQAS